jgi:asparagine synthase (glutamine-hydrolysing)
MSGFFGIFRPQGGPVDQEEFEQMKTAMHRAGFDGMETHVEDKIAMGHLMLRVSPESKHDKQPLKSACGNYLLVGHFRLDYRDELGDKLGLTQAELDVTPDSQLVMLSYQKWKEKCVHHLEGDWAFVIFIQKLNDLIFFKDKYGISAICFKCTCGTLYFSSDACRFVFNFFKGRDLNLKQLCRISYVGIGVEDGKTLFDEIQIVKNAHLLIFDNHLIVREINYYHVNEKESIRYSRDEDYYAEMHSIYSLAILSRIRKNSKVGSFLSSGLDSTSVVHITSLILKKHNSTLSTFTSYPEFINEIENKYHASLNEKPLVEIFVKNYSNIEAHYFTFPQNNIIDLFNSHLIYDPIYPIVTSNSFWIEGIYSAASEKKIKQILTGQMGNFTISWHGPFNQFNLLLKLKLKELFIEIIEFRRKNKCSYLYAIKEKILSEHYRQIVSLGNNIFFSKSELSDFKKDFLNNNQSTNLHYEISKSPGYRLFYNSREMRRMLLIRSLVSASYFHFRDSTHHALEVIDPTADLRLIEFSFSISESMYNKRGLKKYIYRKMMEFQLPSEILYQNLKIPQSSDISIRLKQQKAKILCLKEQVFKGKSQEIIKDFRLDFLDVFDSRNIQKVYQNRRDSIKLLRKLSLSKFIYDNLL